MQQITIRTKSLIDAVKILNDLYGSFGGYQHPLLLLRTCEHVIKGHHDIQMEKRKVISKSSAPILAQHFVQGYKIDHQASWTSANKESDFDVRR